jgi:hypothetical protein
MKQIQAPKSIEQKPPITDADFNIIDDEPETQTRYTYSLRDEITVTFFDQLKIFLWGVFVGFGITLLYFLNN